MTTTTDSAAKQEAIRKAHSEATTAIREKHRDEYNSLVKAAVKRMGFDWSPRLTAEEKAEAEIQRLLAENPALAAKFQPAAEAEQPDD